MVSMTEKHFPYLTQSEHRGDYKQTTTGEQTVRVAIVEAHLLICMALQRVIGSFPLVQV